MEEHRPHFSRRVENYIQYRPPYPESIIKVLERVSSDKGCRHVCQTQSMSGILINLWLAYFLFEGRVRSPNHPNSAHGLPKFTH